MCLAGTKPDQKASVGITLCTSCLIRGIGQRPYRKQADLIRTREAADIEEGEKKELFVFFGSFAHSGNTSGFNGQSQLNK